MISKNLYVLTPVEQQELGLVDTTLSQAWQIYERNMPLLEALYDEEFHDGEIGCPHCCEDFKCEEINCSWLAVHLYAGVYSLPCTRQTFGGVAYNGLLVGYGWDDESLDATDPCGDPTDTETFLLGHIEWAQRLIDGEMPCVEEDV